MEYSDNSYTLPDDTDFDLIKGFLDEFLEATTDMSCNDLVTELDDIGNAITALSLGGGCGCGSGGGGATSPAVETTDTGDITLVTGTPPDGYPDWETYQTAKCNIAHFIIQSLLDDVRWWQTVQIGTMTLAYLAAGVVSIMSALTLSAILAGLLGILAYEILMLEDAEEQLETGFSDLLCAIIAGETAQESMDNFISEMTTQMTTAITDPISEFLIIQLLTTWVDTAFFNLLYAPYEEFLGHQIPGGADCSDCGLGCVSFWTSIGTWQGGLTWAGELSGAAYYIGVHFNATSDACGANCGPMETFSLAGMEGYTPKTASNDSFRIWSDAVCPWSSGNADVYSSDTPLVFDVQYCGRVVQIFSATPFTATFERFGHCY